VERQDFLILLQQSCKDLKKIFSQKNCEWLFAICNGKNPGRECDLTIDKLFELFCFFSLLSKLSSKVDLKHKKSLNAKGFRLPLSPGKKKNF
jgi:hypothetical protein